MRSGRLVGAAETSKERAEWRRLQRKKLNILGLLKRKEWPQCHREKSWQVHLSRLCQKEKEQSRLSRVPDHEGERVKVSESCTFDEREGDQIDLQTLGRCTRLCKPGHCERHMNKNNRQTKDGGKG